MSKSSSFLTKSFYCLPRSNAVSTQQITDGVLVRSDTAAKYPSGSPVITLLNNGVIDTTATGVKVTHTFKTALPEAASLTSYVRCRAKWRIVANSPAGALGRMNFNVKHNGAAITGLTKFEGAIRALNAGPGTDFPESWMVVKMPATERWAAGDTLEIVIELEVTTAAAGNTLEVGFHIDPATAGAELVVEFDQAGE